MASRSWPSIPGAKRNKPWWRKPAQLGREFVVQTTGLVKERESKNKNIPTGEVESWCTELKVLNGAKTAALHH
jgi:aspartyl-tRNA synthetase